jgi:hypothetical protein
MNYPKTKIDIINVILAEAKDDPDFPWNNISPEKLVFEWFITGRAGSGLRLTDSGSQAFKLSNIAHYDFDFTPPSSIRGQHNWSKYTLVLDKKIKCPYYIGIKLTDKDKKQPYIRIYDHQIAMMLSLYGDIESYIESIK